MDIHHRRHAPSLHRLLLRFTLLLLGVSALLVVAARAFGVSQPPSAALAGLRLSDCVLPCWLGITPGATAMTDAAHRLSAANLGGTIGQAIDGRSVWEDFEVNGFPVYVQIHGNEEGVVRQIAIIAALVDGIVFGDVVNDLGIPTCGRFSQSFALYSGDTAEVSITGVGPQAQRGIWVPLNNIIIRQRFEDFDRCYAIAS